MEMKDAALLIKLRELFTIEAQEHVQAITTGLLELEKQPEAAQSAKIIETLYREVHTLKGAARAVNLTEVETICQVTESVCGALKRGEFRVWPEFFDALHRAMDVVRQLSTTPEETQGVGAPVGLVKELEALEAHGRAQTAEHALPPLVSRQLVVHPIYGEGSQPEKQIEELQSQKEPLSAVSPQEGNDCLWAGASPAAMIEPSEPSPPKKRRRSAGTPRTPTPKKPRSAKKKTAAREEATNGAHFENILVAEPAKSAAIPVAGSAIEKPAASSGAVTVSLIGDQSQKVEDSVFANSDFPRPLEFQEALQAEERFLAGAEDSTREDFAQGEMLTRLRGIFALEAEEYFHTLTRTVLTLEQEQDEGQEKVLLETLFRCIHSLKGAARAVNFREIEELCQVVENVCLALKRKEFSVWPEFFDSFHRVLDAVRQLSTAPEGRAGTSITDLVTELTRLEAHGRARASKTQARLTPSLNAPPASLSEEYASTPPPDLSGDEPAHGVVQEELLLAEEEPPGLSPEALRELFDAPPAPGSPKADGVGAATQPEKIALVKGKGAGSHKAASPADVVRVETAKLDSLFLQAEEMLAVKLKTHVHASELRGLTVMVEAWKREWAKAHTDIRKTQRILEKEENRDSRDPLYEQTGKLIDFLDWTHAHFKAVDKALTKIAHVVAHDQQSLSGMVDVLLEEAKKTLMLPFSSALEVLPKMVRDLSRAQGKSVEFSLQGAEIEVDKRILEEIKDPLIHLLRNCIDHGVESPADREREQKPGSSSITVAISTGEGNTVELVVQDDGAGINVAMVKDAAVKNGSISRETADQLTDSEAVLLIFQSEVSTSAVVSTISGRGLGMAIVREKVEKLGGRITVETRRHEGTTFRIALPLTLATFRGVLVQAAGQTFVVPTVNVERVIRVHRSAIQVTGNGETVSLAGHTLPLLRLESILGLATKKRDEKRSLIQLALVVGQGEQQIAFGVDAVLSEQEVLFKGLGTQLARVRNIAGATILGSGQVAPILNVNDLLTTIPGPALRGAPTSAAVEAEPSQKSILVAEDSITSRMLLKEILESAGYVVSTAIDGEAAFSSLQKTKFDLVVSDVEMPRMNGFDLASKIRGDERYAHLPVVLVTGLESQTDRERGVSVGANAYVVKGNFDQSNLLETIRQFL